jgi:hypothetical protein
MNREASTRQTGVDGSAVPGLMEGNPSPKGRQRPRVLLVADGWPTGTLEVASWLKAKDKAEAAVYNMRPSRLGFIKSEFKAYLSEGSARPEVVKLFISLGHRLDADATVKRKSAGSWEIAAAAGGRKYALEERNGGIYVFDEGNARLGEAEEALRGLLKRKGIPEDALFGKDGHLRQHVSQIVHSVGGGFVKKLIEFDPHIVGFRAEGDKSHYYLSDYVELVRHFSDAIIVVGGPSATTYRADSARRFRPNFMVSGEGEEPFERLVEAVGARNRRSKFTRDDIRGIRGIPGVSSKRNINTATPILSEESLDSYRLDWSLMEGYRYGEMTETSSLYYSTSRGCPYDCSFCDRIHSRKFRAKSPQRMMEDIAALDRAVDDGTINAKPAQVWWDVDDAAIRGRRGIHLGLTDENFLLDRGRALEFFRLWERSGLSPIYRLGIQTSPASLVRGGRIDEELMGYIDRLKIHVQLGIETFNPPLLERLKKPHTTEEGHLVLDRMDASGQRYAAFQELSDYDTMPEEAVETVRLLALNHMRHPRMDVWVTPFLSPSPGTDTYKTLERKGLRRGEDGGGSDFFRSSHPELMDPSAAKLLKAADGALEHLRVGGYDRGQVRQIYLAALGAMGAAVGEGSGASKAKSDPMLNRLAERISKAKEDIVLFE